jgi:predicted Rossmann fold flavoprotein
LKEYDLIIIGSGPAGLFAAIHIKNDKKVLILEKNSTAGKKLLITGSGQCNITHSGDISDFAKHYGDNGGFLRFPFTNFSNEDLKKFFIKRGLAVKIDKNNKIFPRSRLAQDILNILLRALKNNIECKYDLKVLRIENANNSFQVTADKGTYLGKHLMIATGGKSYPQTGSTGDGYNFASRLGHLIIPPKPSLAPIIVEGFRFNAIAGTSLQNVKINLYRNNKKIRKQRGDILFTHTGLSGPGILDFSRYFENNDMLKINLTNRDPEESRLFLFKSTTLMGKKSVKNFLKVFKLPENLLQIILQEQKIALDKRMSDLRKNQRTSILKALCEHPFLLKKIGNFKQAMATCGGISLKEVSPKTMESRLMDNLYFAGEVLDLDGDTGGYNLQAAFSTAFTAAKAINTK